MEATAERADRRAGKKRLISPVWFIPPWGRMPKGCQADIK